MTSGVILRAVADLGPDGVQCAARLAIYLKLQRRDAPPMRGTPAEFTAATSTPSSPPPEEIARHRENTNRISASGV
jgi:hypothetical protein